jgi:hypothetical protein
MKCGLLPITQDALSVSLMSLSVCLPACLPIYLPCVVCSLCLSVCLL